MRNLNALNCHRRYDRAVIDLYGSAGDDETGVFELPSTIDGRILRVIASSGDGWDHVSVSRANRCPNWPEMEQVFRLFFRDDETAMQLHVPLPEHINQHPFCLHIWRALDAAIPKPPPIFVGGTQAEADAYMGAGMTAKAPAPQAETPLRGRKS